MTRTLRDFAALALSDNRIGFGDLRRLQRDVLPSRITTREEAELLLILDATADKADRDWPAYLIAAVRDFAVWGLPPVGSVDRSKAEWLSTALSRGHPATARAIVREVLDDRVP